MFTQSLKSVHSYHMVIVYISFKPTWRKRRVLWQWGWTESAQLSCKTRQLKLRFFLMYLFLNSVNWSNILACRAKLKSHKWLYSSVTGPKNWRKWQQKFGIAETDLMNQKKLFFCSFNVRINRTDNEKRRRQQERIGKKGSTPEKVSFIVLKPQFSTKKDFKCSVTKCCAIIRVQKYVTMQDRIY